MKLIGFIFVAFIAIDCTYSAEPPPCAPPAPSASPAPSGLPAPSGPPAPGGPPTSTVDAEIPPNSYPNARRDETVQDTYPGNVIVHDPYRWMEDPKSEETKKFIDAENALTSSYLKKATFQKQLQAAYQSIDLSPTQSAPLKIGKYWFTWRNNAKQVQDVFYVQESLTGPARIVLDPNTWSKDDSILLDSDSCSLTEDGTILAYSIITDGSDWRTVQFCNVETGHTYKDKLIKVKFSDLEWTFDNKGIFYAAYPDTKDLSSAANESNTARKLFYHYIGTDQSKDILVVEFPKEPDIDMAAKMSIDGRYVLVPTQNGTPGNSMNVVDLEKIKYEIKGKLDLIPIITDTENSYDYVANINTTFILATTKDAPNNKIVTIDIGSPDPAKTMKDLIPTNENIRLNGATPLFGKYLLADYTQDVKTLLQLHDINTGKFIKKFETEIGTLSAIYGSWTNNDVYLTMQSFLIPSITYHCDLSKPPFNLDVFQEDKRKNFDRQKYTVEQIFYKSKDGTKIPMYIIAKKGVQKNGNNFVYLYGYGGFGTSTVPSFEAANILIINNFDGIYAVASIRGGGEYGEKWHEEGAVLNKQNSFDDFQAAAQYLIAEKYTNPKLLAAYGGSNGGTVVAASLNQRPDLFAAGIIDGGVLDMLRYDKFTGGKGWHTEYGDPSKKTEFDALFKYSPLHNVKIPEDAHLQYPATLVITSVNDNRVPPLHALKFIATLQHLAKCCNPKQKNPLIVKAAEVGGHDVGSAVDEMFAFIDEMSFVSIALGIKFHP